MTARTLASLEARFRPFLVRLPPPFVIPFDSRGRRTFLAAFDAEKPRRPWVPEGFERTLWGLRFRSPLLNAAGMFKNGEGYDRVFGQGAGAYLAGTSTGRPRKGNLRGGVAMPFAPYPQSGAASNWLGLPNRGHREVARRLAKFERREAFPIGASLAADPDSDVGTEARLEALLAGLEHYAAAGVDFLEINESCPNTEEGPRGLEDLGGRLRRLSQDFLARRTRNLPVVLKLSCDTASDQVAPLVDLLLELGFDGVNFGNTSTEYDRHRPHISSSERPLFDHFREAYGGGLSGRPLKQDSLRLCAEAVQHVERVRPGREFHVVRTGGVETAEDLRRSLDEGIALCQWYTGYFESFAHHGDAVYRKTLEGL